MIFVMQCTFSVVLMLKTMLRHHALRTGRPDMQGFLKVETEVGLHLQGQEYLPLLPNVNTVSLIS